MTAAEACAGSHIVACATNAIGPVFFNEFIEPGMHVGGIRPGASEIDRGAWPRIDVFALLDRDDNVQIVRPHGVRLGEEEEGGMYGMPHDEVHASMPHGQTSSRAVGKVGYQIAKVCEPGRMDLPRLL